MAACSQQTPVGHPVRVPDNHGAGSALLAGRHLPCSRDIRHRPFESAGSGLPHPRVGARKSALTRTAALETYAQHKTSWLARPCDCVEWVEVDPSLQTQRLSRFSMAKGLPAEAIRSRERLRRHVVLSTVVIGKTVPQLLVGAVIGVLVTFHTEGRTMAAEQDTELRNRQAVRAAFDAWKEGTGGVFDLLAPDARWTIVGRSLVSRTYESRREFMDAVIHPFNARLSQRLIPTVRGVYADGDTVVVLWDGEGTARDGRPYRNTYSWYLQMREGRAVNVVAFFDSIEFNDLWTRVEPVAP